MIIAISLALVGLTAAAYVVVLHLGYSTLPQSSTQFLHKHWQLDCGPRSPAQIVTTCALTMIVCIVITVHPDVPPKSADGRGYWDRIRSAGWLPVLVQYKVAYWTLALVAPDILVLIAVCDFSAAEQDVDYMHSKGYIGWTYRHAFFASMGGLRLRDGTRVLSGRQLYTMEDSELQPVIENLNLQVLLDDINDKSKGDWLTKSLAAAQVSHFLIDAFSRAEGYLPISPLECITWSHVACMLFAYAMWVKKPYNVQEPICLEPCSRYFVEVSSHVPDVASESNFSFRRRLRGLRECQSTSRQLRLRVC